VIPLATRLLEQYGDQISDKCGTEKIPDPQLVSHRGFQWIDAVYGCFQWVKRFEYT
jgi:hypothetical protein